MPRWEPKDNERVGVGENVGRRLFDEPKLSGAPDQKPFKGLDLRNFEESRDREFSIDRLGKSSVDKAVIKYLKPRAEHHGSTKFKKARRFDGWAHISARKLCDGKQWAIYSSPVREIEVDGAPMPWVDGDLAQNKYHAHVLMPDAMESDLFAYEIREHFEKFGDVYRIRPPDAQPPDEPPKSRLSRFWTEILRKLGL